MAVFKRGRFYWFQFMFDGQRVQKSTQQCDREQAKKIEGAYRTNLALGKFGIKAKKTERLTVGELLDRKLARWKMKGKDSVANRSKIKCAKKDFGARMADALTKEDMDAYIERCQAKGLAPATINDRTELVRSAFKCERLTPPETSKLHVSNVRAGFFSPAEFRAVHVHLPDELKDFVQFAYLTGWRFGSIAALRWVDVDLEAAEINLPGEFTKNGEPLKLPLVDAELAELFACRKIARVVRAASGTAISALVFHRAGKPVEQFRDEWIRACLAAGQGKMVCPKCEQDSAAWMRTCSHCRKPMKYQGRLFHDFHRSAARDLIRSGVAQTVAMKVTGHKSSSMFRRYNIVDTDDVAAALRSVKKYRDEQRGRVRSIAAQG